MIWIWWYICDTYVDVSHVFDMFDIFDDIYYDRLNDMPDDICWYLKIADIFDDIFDDDWGYLIFFKIIVHIILMYFFAVWELMVYNFGQ